MRFDSDNYSERVEGKKISETLIRRKISTKLNQVD